MSGIEISVERLRIILQIFQVIFAVAVTVVPLYYRRHSLYACRSRKAIGKLTSEDPRSIKIIDGDELDLRWVEKGETGFDEIMDAVKKEGVSSGDVWTDDLSGEVSKVGLVDGSQSPLQTYVGFEAGTAAGPQAALYVEYLDGSRELLNFRAFDANSVRGLVNLKSWIDERLRERSHYLTSILAIWFTVTSFILIYVNGLV